MMKRVMALLLLMASACASPVVPGGQDRLGTWEKQDQTLPPISLTLSAQGTQLLARLRLSGVESNGMAFVDGVRLRLTLPQRPEVAGEFVSRTELKLRLDANGPEYLLIKRD
jgi:hypothetical protein